jgi:hypothetical protein
MFFEQDNVFTNDISLSRNGDASLHPQVHHRRSAPALLGSFRNFGERSSQRDSSSDTAQELSVDVVVEAAIEERKWSDRALKLYEAFDFDHDGFLTEKEFIEGSQRLQAGRQIASR